MNSVVASPLRAQSQGALPTAGGSVRWCVWAPRHSTVQLVLEAGGRRRVIPMLAERDGYYALELPDIVAGTRYAYQLGTGTFEFPDPASRWQPDGVHRSSAVFLPGQFVWHDQAWSGLRLSDLVIYELHVGTFTPEGTLEAVLPRLPQLTELGISAIEIMPVSQFPGARNWGYDGVHPYAVQHSYGGPRALQALVDAAHAAGLGVILDVVYNHLGPEGNYLDQFGPYFTPRYHTPWGNALNYDGPDSDPVRHYVIDNACQWIRDFHIDGLRLDAVQTIYDRSAYHLLAELKAEVQRTAAACGRSAIVIAETNQNDARITAPSDAHGFGLDGAWSDDFHHCVHALLTGERDGYYVDFGQPEQLAKVYNDVFAYDGCYSPYRRRRHGNRVIGQPRERFVICIQNHDQIGNRALGERLATLIPPDAQRLAAGLLLITPHTPLLYMGEEYGEANPFAFFCSFGDPALVEGVREGRRREFAEMAFRWGGELPDANAASTFERAKLSWEWDSDPCRCGLRRWYQTLLAARRSWPPLVDRLQSTARTIELDPLRTLLVVQRGPHPQLVAVANLTREPAALPDQLVAGRTMLCSSAEKRFGGQREGLASLAELMPYELVLWGEREWKREEA